MEPTMTWRSIVLGSFIFILVLACGISYSDRPQTLEESDLIGVWQAEYGVDRVDTLTLKADGTYQQIYSEPNGYFYESPWNKWFVEHRASGKIYVHLEGMRYYVSGIGLGESGGRLPTDVPEFAGKPELFYDSGEDRTLEMLDKVILRAIGIESAPRGIGLVHMRTDPDTSDSIFTLRE
jgi:hypothetical protein